MNLNSNSDGEKFSIDELLKIRSCFLELAGILENVATEFENLRLLDDSTDEALNMRLQANQAISRAKAQS
jgi:hypothetical protein